MPFGLDLPGQGLGERDDPVLRDAVGAKPDIRDQPGERRRENDVAVPALGDQSRQERLDTVDRPPQIDIDHEPPVVVAGLHDRTGVGDACVVEHDVDVAEHSKRLIGQVS